MGFILKKLIKISYVSKNLILSIVTSISRNFKSHLQSGHPDSYIITALLKSISFSVRHQPTHNYPTRSAVNLYINTTRINLILSVSVVNYSSHMTNKSVSILLKCVTLCNLDAQ